MVRGSACDEDEATTATNGWDPHLETTEGNLVGVEVDTSTHGVDDGFRLLVDLLLHEMVERTLHDLCQLHLQRLDRSSGAPLTIGISLAEAVDVEFSLCDMGNVVVFKVQDALGVLDDGSSVGGDEEFDGLGHSVL